MNGKPIAYLDGWSPNAPGCESNMTQKKFSPPRRPKNNSREYDIDFDRVE
jgi:hypothetical protein